MEIMKTKIPQIEITKKQEVPKNKKYQKQKTLKIEITKYRNH